MTNTSMRTEGDARAVTHIAVGQVVRARVMTSMMTALVVRAAVRAAVRLETGDGAAATAVAATAVAAAAAAVVAESSGTPAGLVPNPNQPCKRA